jgi:hypothetical protein
MSGVWSGPVTGPNWIRTFMPTNEYGGSPCCGGAAASQPVASRSAALLRNSLITSGQLPMSALIRLTIGEFGSPEVALLTDSGRSPTRIAVNT